MGVRARRGAASAAAGVGLLVGALAAAGCADTGGGAPRPVAATATATRCTDERFPIYFAQGSAELPPGAREVIRSASNRVSGCRIKAVDVVGVAAADAALTRRRVDVVTQALAAAGLPSPTFDVQVTGAASPPGPRAPLARRTEVVLHAVPAG